MGQAFGHVAQVQPRRPADLPPVLVLSSTAAKASSGESTDIDSSADDCNSSIGQELSSPCDEREVCMENGEVSVAKDVTPTFRVCAPAWVDLGITPVECRCRSTVLDQTIAWLSGLAPEQRPRSVNTFERAARRLLTVKAYCVDPLALADALGATQNVRDAVRAKHDADALPEERLRIIRTAWMKLLQSAQHSVSQMALWIESQAFVRYKCSVDGVVKALLECGLVTKSSQSALDFSAWEKASMRKNMQRPADSLFESPNRRRILTIPIVRRIELPPGCTARRLIGVGGARIAEIRKRLTAHIYEHLPELKSQTAPLIFLKFGSTAVMLTVRLTAHCKDCELKLATPKAANAAFKNVLLDFLCICREEQRAGLEETGWKRTKLHEHLLSEGQQYQAHVCQERRSHACQSSLQRALTIPAADTRQDISTLPCIKHFRTSPLKGKARQRRQRVLAEKRSTLLRVSRLLERHQKQFRGKACAVGERCKVEVREECWLECKEVFANLCVGVVPSEINNGGQRAKKTAKRLQRQLKHDGAMRHPSLICLHSPSEMLQSKRSVFQKRDQRHSRSKSVRQHFAADRAECLRLQQEGYLF